MKHEDKQIIAIIYLSLSTFRYFQKNDVCL